MSASVQRLMSTINMTRRRDMKLHQVKTSYTLKLPEMKKRMLYYVHEEDFAGVPTIQLSNGMSAYPG